MICMQETGAGDTGVTSFEFGEIDAGWCCIRSHPKREHIAAAQLNCVPGVEVFNPQLRLERQTRRGRMFFTESLFVNYLFARFVPETTLETVRYTPSVKT